MDKLFKVNDDRRLDLNITIGIISRTLFFLAVIWLRDLNKSKVGELVIFILSSLIFHIFILTENKYISSSQSFTKGRENLFKIADAIQLIMIAINL